MTQSANCHSLRFLHEVSLCQLQTKIGPVLFGAQRRCNVTHVTLHCGDVIHTWGDRTTVWSRATALPCVSSWWRHRLVNSVFNYSHLCLSVKYLRDLFVFSFTGAYYWWSLLVHVWRLRSIILWVASLSTAQYNLCIWSSLSNLNGWSVARSVKKKFLVCVACCTLSPPGFRLWLSACIHLVKKIKISDMKFLIKTSCLRFSWCCYILNRSSAI